jgi:carbonic anhydrase/acetyltransferase-like protein (isoleucine patch superfamily)
MNYEVDGRRPIVDATATIAPTAVLSGDVRVGSGTHISFGSVLLGDEAAVVIGDGSLIRENVVVRAGADHPARIGSGTLVGAHSALYGCVVEEGVFLATGVCVFHGAVVEAGAEVRINATVHANSRVPAGATVPIGWIAVGDPAQLLPPSAHEEIWAIQRGLRFSEAAYGLERPESGEVPTSQITARAIQRLPRGWRHLD